VIAKRKNKLWICGSSSLLVQGLVSSAGYNQSKKGQACIHKKKKVVIWLVVLQQLRTCLFVIINDELWTQKLVEFLKSNMKMLL
jgi:hypothetical protein